MYRGIYGATSAMLVQEKAIDVTSNNLANIDTVGFKRRIAVNKSFPEVLVQRRESVEPLGKAMYWPIGNSSLNVVLSETAIDASEGVVRVTDNLFDVAISGRGFFSLQDGAGNVFYTRAGNFTLDFNGVLVTQEGQSVAGEGGTPIVVGDADIVEISESGAVIADGEVVGQIQLFDFQDPTHLRNVGKNLFQVSNASGEPLAVEVTRLIPGALERSNVNVICEMVRLIEGQRAYEASARSLTIQDEQTGSLITTFGRS